MNIYLGVGFGNQKQTEEYVTALGSLDNALKTIRHDNLGTTQLVANANEIERKMVESDLVILPLSFNIDLSQLPSKDQRVSIIKHVNLFKTEYYTLKKLRESLGNKDNDISASTFKNTDIIKAEKYRVFLCKGNAAIIPNFVSINKLIDCNNTVTQIRDDAHGSHGAPDFFSDHIELKRQCMTSVIRVNPKMKLTVMLSSTSTDLKLTREKVGKAIEALGHDVKDFSNQPNALGAIQGSIKLVHDSNFYFGMSHLRYGNIVENNKSLTELEFDTALRAGKPLFFILSNNTTYTQEDRDIILNMYNGEDKRNIEFRERIRANAFISKECNNIHQEAADEALKMLAWSAKPFIDQQALPPGHFSEPYIAYPYALLDESEIISRKQVTDVINNWFQRIDSKILSIDALGGMGKSAVVWSWLHHEKNKITEEANVCWWSFYGKNSGIDPFCSNVLTWIQGNDNLSDLLNTKEKIDILIKSFKPKSKFLFILDGIERQFSFYNSEVSKETEGIELDIVLQKTIEREKRHFGMDEEKTRRWLLKFYSESNKEPEDKPGDESELAYFLSRCLKLINVKIIITSRFIPTVIQDFKKIKLAEVELHNLKGLTCDELKEMWVAAGLEWSDSPLSDELGGFSLNDLCYGTLEGYALPNSILIQLVKDSSYNNFEAWKSSLPKHLRNDDWRKSGIDGLKAAERASGILLSILLNKLTDTQKEILNLIMESKDPMSFSDIIIRSEKMSNSVNVGEVIDILNQLRGYKIVGREKDRLFYEIHPRMRDAIRNSATDNSPLMVRWKNEVKLRWDSQSENSSILVGMEFINQRFDDIKDFLEANAIIHSFDLFWHGIEPFLRFRTTDENILEKRRDSLIQFEKMLNEVERQHQISSNENNKSTEIGQQLFLVRLALSALSIDNYNLMANCIDIERHYKYLSENRSYLDRLAKGETAIKNNYEKFDIYYCFLRLADFYESNCNWKNCFETNRKILDRPTCDSYRWAGCRHANFLIGIGKFDAAFAVYLKLKYIYGGSDADIENIQMNYLLNTGRAFTSRGFIEVKPESVLEKQRSITSELFFGQLAFQVNELIYKIRFNPAYQDFVLFKRDYNLLLEKTKSFPYLTNQLLTTEIEYMIKYRIKKDLLEKIQAQMTRSPISCDQSNLAELQVFLSACYCLFDDLEKAKSTMRLAQNTALLSSPYCQLRVVFMRWSDWFGKFNIDIDFALAEESTIETPESLISKIPDNNLFPDGITNTSGWADDQIREKLEEVKKNLDWQNTTGSANKWWEAFEKENITRIPLVLRLAEELQNRSCTITEFFLAYVYSNTDNIQANLDYLDYTNYKKLYESTKKDYVSRNINLNYFLYLEEPNKPEHMKFYFNKILNEIKEISRLKNSELKSEYIVLRNDLDWDNTTGSARKWWEAVENTFSDDKSFNFIMWLARKLNARQGTITDYFLAYVYSNSDCYLANLFYFDYTRMKKAEEKKKKEQNKTTE